MLRNFPWNFWAFNLWVRKNPKKFLPNFPPDFPPQNQKNHRRASAGAQGQVILPEWHSPLLFVCQSPAFEGHSALVFVGGMSYHNFCPSLQNHLFSAGDKNTVSTTLNQGKKTLKTLTSLNKESRLFFQGDNSIWSFPYVSSLSDYSTSRSWGLFLPCDHNIWSVWVHCPQILWSLRKNGFKDSRLLNLRRLRSSRKRMNINRFPGLSRTGWVAKSCLCVLGVHSLWGRKTHKQISSANPGTVPGNFCLCVFLFVFSLPTEEYSFKIVTIFGD